MSIRIKDWREFQHYKNRRPPWIKLHRKLLDDVEFFELSGADFKLLAMLWIIASEDDEMEGKLPSIKALAFRLRISENKVRSLLSRLDHWIICDDSGVLASGLQDADPETEKEKRQRRDREREREEQFASLMNVWPKKTKRKEAKAALKKALNKTDYETIVSASKPWIESIDWTKDGGKWAPKLCDWLEDERWTAGDPPAFDQQRTLPKTRMEIQEDYMRKYEESLDG